MVENKNNNNNNNNNENTDQLNQWRYLDGFKIIPFSRWRKLLINMEK